ncbi:hypothetical protein C2G38_2247114 [Gigaspora rosea]|uniref:Uncharacterized protein n=1 Tax=Gigaspora rosea TaxID=44941 RepID=A0A397V3U7_9GLOM|nr:hypothetical protein C2G38_2247114 [Gigaspora rosea]
MSCQGKRGRKHVTVFFFQILVLEFRPVVTGVVATGVIVTGVVVTDVVVTGVIVGVIVICRVSMDFVAFGACCLGIAVPVF